MKVFYADRAAKQLENLSCSDQGRIVVKMRFYAFQTDPLKFAKCLSDEREGRFRFRIGDHRVVFDVKNDTIYVLKIGKRESVYN